MCSDYTETVPKGEATTITRILLANITPFWRLKLSQIVESDRDMETVGRVRDPLNLLIQAGKLQANVVVLMQLPEGEEPGICSHLLLEHPNMLVLLLPSRPDEQPIIRMQLRKEKITDTSQGGLHAALKLPL